MDRGSQGFRPTRADFAIALLLSVATIAVYAQVVDFEFVRADDQTYVTDNLQVQQGFNPRSLGWAFTSFEGSNWHPLTWLSHMLDIELFGMWAGGHHATNVLLHVVNVLLLFALLFRMSGDRWPSAFVAALFALHPLHVESVAWVSERKDVLSTCFGLLALHAYVAAATARSRGMYPVALLFALSLLAKPMLVTLPFLMVLLDYWPLGRLRVAWLPPVAARSGVRVTPIKGLVREKLPLFALTAASCLMTYAAQQAGGAVKATDVVPMALRFANACVAYVLYLGKMLWPLQLGVLYPHPYVEGTGGEPWAHWQIVGSLLLLIALTWLALRVLRRPYAIVGWLWYLGTLVPVIGLVQVGNQALADRYTYVPLVGIFVALAWAGQEALKRGRATRTPAAASIIGAAVGVTLATASAALTFQQTHYWRDSILLFDRALEVAPNNSIIHVALSASYNEQGKMDDAIHHARLALEIKPAYVDAYMNLGNAWIAKGDAAGAAAEYEKALAIDPARNDILYNLGNALSRLGRTNEAIAAYERAIELDPIDARFWHNLGRVCGEAGRVDEAIRYYERALELDADMAVSHYMLGRILSDQLRHAEAEAHYRRAIEIDPRHSKARYHLERAIQAVEQQ